MRTTLSASRYGWRTRSTVSRYRCIRGPNGSIVRPGCRLAMGRSGRPTDLMGDGMGLGERLRDYFSPREVVDTSPKVSDEVKYTTCYMCACRCGIKVHLKDGAIRYTEGNRNHPVNRGVISGKSASGIMQQHSPAKLRKPLKRLGEPRSGEFREIEWEESIATAV